MEALEEFTMPSNSTQALPSGFLQIIDIYETGQSGGTLDYLPPQNFYSLDNSRGGSGQPAFYTIIGTDLKFSPLTDSTTRSYALNYFKEFDGLTEFSPTNTLITIAPDIYLWGVLLEAQPYMADQVRTAEFEALYRKAVDGLHASDVRSRHRPRGTIRVDGVTPEGAFRI